MPQNQDQYVINIVGGMLVRFDPQIASHSIASQHNLSQIMPKCSTSLCTEVQDPNNQNAPSVNANSSGAVDPRPLQLENADKENIQEVGDDNKNVDEEEDEEEDVDFNPSLLETHSVEASSSLSSEVEDLDTDVADSGGQPSVAFVKKANSFNLTIDGHTIGDLEHGEEIMIQNSVSTSRYGPDSETVHAKITDRQLASTPQSKSEALGDKKNGPKCLKDVGYVGDSSKALVDMDTEGAISMRTRARYSLASFTLDELETFLQETDDEDDLQNVDDEKEYKKFLAAVLQGDDSPNLKGNPNAEDEDEENDADFELELEEALESDPDEIEERRTTRRNRRQKPSLGRSKKTSGQLNRPLRPLLPFVSLGSFLPFGDKQLAPSITPSNMPPVNNGFTGGFTPHQIGQLHCLIHEHIQLLIQVFSVCVLDHSKSDVSADVKKLILGMLQHRDQVLGWRALPYPRFCFFPPYIQPSVPDELNKVAPLHSSNINVNLDLPSGSNEELPSDVISSSNMVLPDEHTSSFETSQCSSWKPYISGPVLSVTDVAPLRLVRNYMEDVSSAVQAYRRNQVKLGSETHTEKDPLFHLNNSPCSVEPDGQGERDTCPQDSSGMPSSSIKQVSKKTMAATLIEKSKNQSVILVPKEIAKLAQRFLPLFNPVLFPRKPPPAALVKRVLFTDTEDELLALGLMEYNTDWKAIQQRFLPCKSRHQIFVRQKNRSSSKAPENPIKAVRRMKNSPLTSEEIARIDLGLKRFKLDWISIWRFLIPHRDPSLLPRQWRIACGTQKAYKTDANKKEKRRIYDSSRKASRPSAPTWHSSSDKEVSDIAADETNNREDRTYKEDEAYVHEAFLADWRPDSNVSLNSSTHLSSHIGSPASQQKNDFGSANLQPLMCPTNPDTMNPQVIIRPYRARKSSPFLVKLAPNLPPVNLPPSVRVMSQSAFKSSQAEASTSISGSAYQIGGMVAKGGVPQGGSIAKSGQFMSNPVKITASDQHKRHTEALIGDKCVAEERDNSDLQMHPLLFQAPQLPYYPMHCSTSSLAFFSEKQPQLNLGLFHNPRHIKDAVDFLSKTAKPQEKKSSSSDVDFHPLLHDDVDKMVPSNAESNERDISHYDNSSTSGTKVNSTSEKVNELDLDIYLSFNFKNQEAVESRNMTANSPITGLIESDGEKDTVPNGTGQNIDSGDLSLLTSRKKGSRKVADILPDESLPGIIMEQEELSDSEEEFGEDVEFDHEEMADSEGDDTSGSDELPNTTNEEGLPDEMEEDIDNIRVVNSQGDCEGITCSTSTSHPIGLELADNMIHGKSHVLSLNLNSHPPASPHSNAVAKFDFGPFGPSHVPTCSKISDTGYTLKHDKESLEHLGLSSNNTLKRKPRKRVCRSNSSDTSFSGCGKRTPTSNIDNVDNSKKISKDDELG